MERLFHQDNTIPVAGPEVRWVFGSNLAGRHGLGAARVAHKNFGAEYGVGEGPTGRAYAIPTKARPTMNAQDVLSLADIAASVAGFLEYARAHPQLRFFVTRVGCGLSGLDDAQVAPLFAAAPTNCSMPAPWQPYL